MDAEGELDVGVGHFGGVAEDVDCEAADGGEEEFDVAAGYEFGVGAAGFFEEGAAEGSFVWVMSV